MENHQINGVVPMSEEINHDRRRFLRNALMTFAAAELVTTGSANAQSDNTGLNGIPPR